ncbi:hypothetical protein HA402_014489 [Bradysia odoriphaga]|nr:hypothetical protein HA402_014489 [Bradysia odoriphaga]
MEVSPLVISYKQKRYDLTRFQHKHPGGLNTLKGLNNQDIEQRFEKAPPHSEAALYLMKEYELKSAKEANNNNSNGFLKNGIANGHSNSIGNGSVHAENGNGSIPHKTDESMEVPFDPYRLVFPPVPATILATLFYQPLPLLASCPKIVLAGGLIGYLCYDMIHYYIHYGSPTFNYMYMLKRYHYQHHFVHHDAGFGISSPIWDAVFGTKIFLRKLKYMLRW